MVPKRLKALLCGLTLPTLGCCCLGIPSIREVDPGITPIESIHTTGEFEEPIHQAACGEECSGIPVGFGVGWHAFKKHMRLKKSPPWPRFHPIPTRPALYPEQRELAEESVITYGRFGRPEATPAQHQE